MQQHRRQSIGGHRARQPISPDDVSTDDIDSWLIGPNAAAIADQPTAVYGGDTLHDRGVQRRHSLFQQTRGTTGPSNGPSASDDEYERQPDDEAEEDEPFDQEEDEDEERRRNSRGGRSTVVDDVQKNSSTRRTRSTPPKRHRKNRPGRPSMSSRIQATRRVTFCAG